MVSDRSHDLARPPQRHRSDRGGGHRAPRCHRHVVEQRRRRLRRHAARGYGTDTATTLDVTPSGIRDPRITIDAHASDDGIFGLPRWGVPDLRAHGPTRAPCAAT